MVFDREIAIWNITLTILKERRRTVDSGNDFVSSTQVVSRKVDSDRIKAALADGLMINYDNRIHEVSHCHHLLESFKLIVVNIDTAVLGSDDNGADGES